MKRRRNEEKNEGKKWENERYIYTGEADLCKKSGEDIFGVLITSAEFLLEKLFNYVQDHLIKKQTIWIKQNFAYVFYTTFKLENCEKLQDYCMECMSEDSQLFTSKNFPSLEEDILYNLLKRDDLQIEEIVAWDFLINWGIEQISDFYDKVRPYKAAIPLHIYEELEEFYYKKTLSKTEILPPRIGKLKIKSNLINSKLANIIASWIDKKDLNNITSSDKYNFDLLYHGSEDGINSKSFRVKCNYRNSCLVLVKKKNQQKFMEGLDDSRTEFRRSTGSQVSDFGVVEWFSQLRDLEFWKMVRPFGCLPKNGKNQVSFRWASDLRKKRNQDSFRKASQFRRTENQDSFGWSSKNQRNQDSIGWVSDERKKRTKIHTTNLGSGDF
ncbi:unnamed protein product [Rhizophagus irregularis]|nr:unnamed protein product [Rhizophagus irregularis]